MRLLHVKNFTLHTYYEDDAPPFAILSHTWLREDEEVSLASLLEPSNSDSMSWRDLPGAQKIIYLCKQAADDGLEYAWMDTCCIDKTNSVELGEAINSMFRWYQQSKTCYAYLIDVDEELGKKMTQSRWWNRAWTLQELVAPTVVHFYDKHWRPLGSKANLTQLVSSRSGIDHETLKQPDTMYVKSIAHRMSWAAHREATRLEDQAYSLLGIFDVNLSMQYGEGSTAFMRLQEKIMNKTNDQTLFAWGFSPFTIEETLEILRPPEGSQTDPESSSMSKNDADDDWSSHNQGIFADTPMRFANCGNLMFHLRDAFTSHIAEFNGALRLDVLLAKPTSSLKTSLGQFKIQPEHGSCIGLLPCGSLETPGHMIGLLLKKWSDGRYRRIELVPGVFTFLVDCHSIKRTDRRTVWIDNLDWIMRHRHSPVEARTFHRSIRLDLFLPPEEYTFELLSANWTFDTKSSLLELYHYKSQNDTRLEMALRRHKTSDYLIIAIKLTNHGDDPRSSFENRVCVLSTPNLDGGPWFTNMDFYQRNVHKSVNVKGVLVKIETHQVFNHLISTLSISCSSHPGFGELEILDELSRAQSSSLFNSATKN